MAESKKYEFAVTAVPQYIADQSDPVNDNYVFAYTITITNTGDVTAQDADIVDAKGALLTPGMVDLGVFATDLAACHAGGITRIALMPDGPPRSTIRD